MSTPPPPPGWYAGPGNPQTKRYWHGQQWTEDRAVGPGASQPSPPVQQFDPSVTGAPAPQQERPTATAAFVCASLMVVGLAIGGCSSGGTDDATASPSPTATASTSPPPSTTTSTSTTSTTIPATTTTVDPRVVAAATYIELVTPLNCSLELVRLEENNTYGSDGYVDPSDWQAIDTELQPAYASHAQDKLTLMNGLIAFDGWPDDVRSEIDALVQELAAGATYTQSMADAPTFDAFVAIGDPPQSSPAATVIRAKLGLESNVGTTTQFCAELAD